MSAAGLGLRVVGTLGVLLRAKRAGQLAQVAPAIHALVEEGFRLDNDLMQAALQLAGEA